MNQQMKDIYNYEEFKEDDEYEEEWEATKRSVGKWR